MARFFAKAQDVNLQNYPVLEKILDKLEKNLVNINEADVLTIMAAFEQIPRDMNYSNKLFSSLNQTVVDVCLSQPENVTINFLANYLSKFFDLQGTGRTITKDNKQSLLTLLESKLTENKDKALNFTLIKSLAKVLINNKQSKVLQQTVKDMFVNNIRRMDYEDARLAHVALKGSIDASLLAETEAQAIEQIKQTKVKSPRILAEFAILIEGFATKK